MRWSAGKRVSVGTNHRDTTDTNKADQLVVWVSVSAVLMFATETRSFVSPFHPTLPLFAPIRQLAVGPQSGHSQMKTEQLRQRQRQQQQQQLVSSDNLHHIVLRSV